jgi:hypothetical protein
MSKLLGLVMALVLVALGVGGYLVFGNDDDAQDVVAGSTSAVVTTTSGPEDADPDAEPSSSGADTDFCHKFSSLSFAQSAASSRMLAIFKDLTDDASSPDPAAIAADLRKFIDRITAAAALKAKAPAEIEQDYAVVEAGLTGATVPYGKLASAAEQSLAAARAYANGSFMDEIGDLATDAYIDSGERVEAWVKTHCGP